jgi:glycolate oxidase iron-sulfur subunit
MQHTIQVEKLSRQMGPQIENMARAIETCVHCGFCLPVCPTYQVLGEEMDSPRGRIILMKSVLEGELDLPDTIPYVSRCLGCLACTTVCPSGVKYGELITPFRSYAYGQDSYSLMEKVRQTLVRETIPYPNRFRSAARLGRLARPVRKVLPGELGSMLDMLPDRLPPARPLPPLLPAEGKRRARVAMLAGCVQQALAPEINWATLRVLTRNGVEVVIPPKQACCGAVLMHAGDEGGALRLARQNLHAFPDDVDAILTNAAGCGSGLKEYELLFKGQPEAEQAVTFCKRVKDVSAFLAELGVMALPPLTRSLKVAYHDACHLLHAQGVGEAPRCLLCSIPNLTLLEVPDGGTCCGSAGTYNIEQPEIAGELGRRKVENILRTGAEAVATGNIGCLVQIRKQLRASGISIPVYHTFEVLDMAYRGI